MCSHTPSHRQSNLQDRASPSEASKTQTSPRSPQTKKASRPRNPNNSSSKLSTSSKKNNRTSNCSSHRNLYTGSSSRHSSSLSIEVCRRIPDWQCEGNSSNSFTPRIPDWFNNRDTLLNRWMRKWPVGCHTRSKWAGCTCLSSSRMMTMSILTI